MLHFFMNGYNLAFNLLGINAHLNPLLQRNKIVVILWLVRTEIECVLRQYGWVDSRKAAKWKLACLKGSFLCQLVDFEVEAAGQQNKITQSAGRLCITAESQLLLLAN